MPPDVVVFLGPTLPRSQAAGILNALYLPPAEQGSVVRAVLAHRPTAIVLIDGAFGSTPAVRHKEIVWALAKGVHVFGAASMGALRAAELSAVGMRGHGFVYRWYALTPLADDDEVAVAMTPPELGAEPLSEALIDIRLTLRRAVRAGILPDALRRRLEGLARETHFIARSYPGLLAAARSSFPPECRAALDRFAAWCPGNAVNQKRDDAVGLLSRLARDPDVLGGQAQPFPFRMTEAWAQDLSAAGLLSDEIGDVGAPP